MAFHALQIELAKKTSTYDILSLATACAAAILCEMVTRYDC
jgi:L-lactate permease